MPGKTVRFETPSPSYSVSSLPSSDGPFTPPSSSQYGSAIASLPPVPSQIASVLQHSRGAPSMIRFDMSLPIEMIGGINQPILAQCATNPPLTSMVVIYGPWKIPIIPHPSSRIGYVTVGDVLNGIYRFFRSASSAKQFNELPRDKQRTVEAAYNARWQRVPKPAERELERAKGVKLIDLLGEYNLFWGLSPMKELGHWQLNVARS